MLLLIIITFVVMMTLPPEGWGGRIAAIAVAALTAIVAFTSSDVRSAACAWRRWSRASPSQRRR